MKTYKVIISQEARQNLKEITAYIRESDSEGRAKYVQNGVLKLAQSLVNIPNRYPALLTSEITGLTYRYVPNKFKLKIIYHVLEDVDAQVIVVSIYHDKQSLKALKKRLS